jgi:hypothetical protein
LTARYATPRPRTPVTCGPSYLIKHSLHRVCGIARRWFYRNIDAIDITLGPTVLQLTHGVISGRNADLTALAVVHVPAEKVMSRVLHLGTGAKGDAVVAVPTHHVVGNYRMAR